MLSEKAAATPDPQGNFIERYIAEQQRVKRDGRTEGSIKISFFKM